MSENVREKHILIAGYLCTKSYFNMELHLKIIGLLLIMLSLIHIVFPARFNWKKELATLSLINREVMYVHTFFIALTVLLMGLLCLTSAQELTETVLGKRIALGFGIFWLVRLIIQFFGYSCTWSQPNSNLCTKKYSHKRCFRTTLRASFFPSLLKVNPL